jgi:hypothetical protein
MKNTLTPWMHLYINIDWNDNYYLIEFKTVQKSNKKLYHFTELWFKVEFTIFLSPCQHSQEENVIKIVFKEKGHRFVSGKTSFISLENIVDSPVIIIKMHSFLFWFLSSFFRKEIFMMLLFCQKIVIRIIINCLLIITIIPITQCYGEGYNQIT